jgi:phosphate transport system permease protein
MQHNPQALTDKKRFRTDAIAKQVVTVFGLLVLAMFVLLILHILSNAFPLLKTPKLNLEETFSISSQSPLLLVQQMGDDVVGLTFGQCQLKVHKLNGQATNVASSASVFNHSCGSSFIKVEANHSYFTHYGILREDSLVELYNISNLSGQIQRSLIGSFNINELNTVINTTNLSKLPWHIAKYESKVIMSAQLNKEEHVVIWHELNTLKAPSIKLISRAHSITPLPRFGQLLIVHENAARLTNSQGLTIQDLNQDMPMDASVLVSPNQRTLYIEKLAGGEQVWRSSNVGGEFLLNEVGSLSGRRESATKGMQSVVFDRQTMIAIGIDEQSYVSIFNSATNEIVSERRLSETVKDMHWHNQQLYLFGEYEAGTTKAYVYSLHNAAGITTWKSLFEEVQYSGYQSPQYIWQTSQSAEYAETKFSLVPLIIGSLKASILALFVAIPLSLGAAIYTAYFASPKLRAWVKPSIEMIEAIPSVIIGFIAAIWLAPFAERSLFALLGMLVSLPFIVLGFALLHSVIKQSEVYIRLKRMYLPLCSIVFLVILTAVFQLFVVLQAAIASGEGAILGTFFIDITLSKTTVVVALALGIAVAPTIYSLVDDALFEVPDGVKQAAFALGATELQTLVKVVLVVALPSIISAIMLGLGRAFGETMIVLMVTGNTPIADWDLLSGLRSLTSNLTIELQESSIGSAHYHILFLTAAILFAFTFVINTIASLLKRRLQADKHV